MYLRKKADARQKVIHFCFFTLSGSLRRDIRVYIQSISTPFHVPDAVTPILYCVCVYIYIYVCVCIYIYIYVCVCVFHFYVFLTHNPIF